jgi:hypothetical protein
VSTKNCDGQSIFDMDGIMLQISCRPSTNATIFNLRNSKTYNSYELQFLYERSKSQKRL